MGAPNRVDRESCRRALPGRLLRAAALGCAAVLALLQISCVVLPVRFASGVSGTVVDLASGKVTVDGAIEQSVIARAVDDAGFEFGGRAD